MGAAASHLMPWGDHGENEISTRLYYWVVNSWWQKKSEKYKDLRARPFVLFFGCPYSCALGHSPPSPRGLPPFPPHQRQPCV